MTKQCAAGGCEAMFEAKGAGKFCPKHRGAKPKKGKKASADAADDGVVMVVAINLSEQQLDRIWSTSTLEEKGLAIQTVLDDQRATGEAR